MQRRIFVKALEYVVLFGVFYVIFVSGWIVIHANHLKDIVCGTPPQQVQWEKHQNAAFDPDQYLKEKLDPNR